MKLWVSVFVAAVWLMLASEGNAKAPWVNNDLQFSTRMLKTRRITDDNDDSLFPSKTDQILVATEFTLLRRYSLETLETSDAFKDLQGSFTAAKEEGKDIPTVMFSKVGDGSYTEDDREYLEALCDVFSDEEGWKTLTAELKSKYHEDEGQRRKLDSLVFKVIPALTTQELKSPDIMDIIMARVDIAMSNGDDRRSTSRKHSRGARLTLRGHVGDETAAKVRRRKKGLEFLVSLVDKRTIGKNNESLSGSKNKLAMLATVFTILRRYPHVDMGELACAINTMDRSLTAGNMEGKDLQADVFSKFGGGSYTEDDKSYYTGLSQVFSKPEFFTMGYKLESQYSDNEAERAKLEGAFMKIIPALTQDDLKSENVVDIIKGRVEAEMDKGGNVQRESGKRTRVASSDMRVSRRDDGKILWETLS